MWLCYFGLQIQLPNQELWQEGKAEPKKRQRKRSKGINFEAAKKDCTSQIKKGFYDLLNILLGWLTVPVPKNDKIRIRFLAEESTCLKRKWA